ncbi:MAG: hypothetical protein U0822_22110 [Anaerolineae bacterium]
MGKKNVEPQSESDKFMALIRRAEGGDKNAMNELRPLLRDSSYLWEEFGNLAMQAERSLIRAFAGKNEIAKEAVDRKMRALRAELAGPNPTPLERVLVERIVACWLALQYAETVYAQNMGDLTIRQADFHQRRLDRAHARYLSAIKTLSQVRRLMQPPLQVNIAAEGSQQVNVAGDLKVQPRTTSTGDVPAPPSTIAAFHETPEQSS